MRRLQTWGATKNQQLNNSVNKHSLLLAKQHGSGDSRWTRGSEDRYAVCLGDRRSFWSPPRRPFVSFGILTGSEKITEGQWPY